MGTSIIKIEIKNNVCISYNDHWSLSKWPILLLQNFDAYFIRFQFYLKYSACVCVCVGKRNVFFKKGNIFIRLHHNYFDNLIDVLFVCLSILTRWPFTHLFCWVRLSMRFCNCSRDTGLGGNITPPSNELSDSHGLSIAIAWLKLSLEEQREWKWNLNNANDQNRH